MTGVWRELAPQWERGRALLWEATRPVSAWLVERLDPQPGQTILDLAAGTGETGFLASARLGATGRLITSDGTAEMLAAAERVAAQQGVTNAEFRVLDTDAIALADASVDGVLSRFGYVLRGETKLPEVRRVLRPGGTFAFAVWGRRERNAWMTVPASVMVERGHLPEQTDEERRLSERRTPEAIDTRLRETGFTQVEVAELPVAYRFVDAEELWFFVSELRGPVALALAKLDDAERASVRAEIETRTPGLELGGVAIVVAAR